MLKNTVVIPTRNRIEFLALTLEKLYLANVGNYAEVRIYLDDAPQEVLDEVDYVRDNYYPAATILQANSHPEALSGCWNILNALKSGYETGSELVFLVEEDVLVGRNYFSWHIKAWKEFPDGLFASCGRFISRYGHNHYTNPGSCFSKKSLEQIVPHICLEYFQDRRGYLDRTFSLMEDASDLDDGLIRRIHRQSGLMLAWPKEPVAFHQGFNAYQLFQQYKNEGAIQQRIDNLRVILSKLNPANRYEKDFEPFQED